MTYHAWIPLAAALCARAEGDREKVRSALMQAGCPGQDLRSVMNHMRASGYLPMLTREESEERRYQEGVKACRLHLLDLQLAGHTSEATERQALPGRDVPTARRLASQLQPARSYCGSPGNACAEV